MLKFIKILETTCDFPERIKAPIEFLKSSKIFPERVKVPRDLIIQKWAEKLHLSEEKLYELYQQFTKFDRNYHGTIEPRDFFLHFLNVKVQNMLYDGLFRLVDFDVKKPISFSAFLHLTCTFSLLESYDLLHFFFFVLDEEKHHMVEKKELVAFLYNIWDTDKPACLDAAVSYLEKHNRNNGLFQFDEICAVHRHYPQIFRPVFLLQVKVHQYSYGDVWWNNKKYQLREEIQERRIQDKKRFDNLQSDAAKGPEAVKERKVKDAMGLKYYLCPCRRAHTRERLDRMGMLAEIKLEDI